jgi:ATP-dependent Lhr-like helicase
VRRGYFAGGVGATQFALPAALELLRSLRDTPDEPEVILFAATDPANAYGTTLKWSADGEAGRTPTRTVGARVILVNGALAAYIPRGGRQITVFLPEDEPARSTIGHAVARALASHARQEWHGGLLIAEVNGQDPARHPIAPFLIDAGFNASAMGFQMRRPAPAATARQS